MGKINDALEKRSRQKVVRLTGMDAVKHTFDASSEDDLPDVQAAQAQPKAFEARTAPPPRHAAEGPYPPRAPHPSEAAYPRLQPARNPDKNLVTMQRPDSFESEQFKMLRSVILYPLNGASPRNLLITSAVPGEGKTFVTANLGVSLAQSIDKHVLLIDCDLRRPCLHKMFGFDQTSGLTDYLQHDVPLEQLLRGTGVRRLSLLPSGTPPRNPAELLGSGKMHRLLREVRDRYEDRTIIIDSPPPPLTSEATTISRWVDGIILVVQYGRTKREVVLDMIEQLGRDKIIGTVMNRFDLRSSAYYGIGSYRKYGRYRKYRR